MCERERYERELMRDRETERVRARVDVCVCVCVCVCVYLCVCVVSAMLDVLKMIKHEACWHSRRSVCGM